MLQLILNLNNVQVLSKEELQIISGAGRCADFINYEECHRPD